jgi:nitroimidazol reductase NimA-like FMN-containing flavoprotein (pyridoxamine 5'-phosphate oxidase superfamily)
MPDYGVDSASWTPLPWSWALERLLINRNFWVVTVSADGRPHALPVWGVWDKGENCFAFSCGPRSRKAQNLKANPQVAIMTEDTVECISLEGRAAPVPDPERQEVWVERYLAKYRPLSADLSAEFIRQNVVVEFEPDRALAVIEREAEFATRATRWRFGP